MAGADEISIDDFRVLVARTGLTLSDQQIEVLRPLYDYYAGLTVTLHGPRGPNCRRIRRTEGTLSRTPG